MNPIRRIVGGVRWRVRRQIDLRRRRRGPVGIGSQRIPYLVIHAPVPPGYTTAIGASLAASAKALSRRGVAVLSAPEIRDLGGAGWSGVADDPDQVRFAAAIRAAISKRTIVGRPRALILSSGRALGRDRLRRAEAQLLRPDAVATLGDLIAATQVRRVIVVLELPVPDSFRDELLSAGVEAGHQVAPPPAAVDGLYEELATRVAGIPGVDRVVTLSGGDDTPEQFAAALAPIIGLIALRPAPDGVTPRWTQRSILAAAATNAEVSGAERRKVHALLRSRLASPPARRPLAAIPAQLSPSAIHVVAGTDPMHLHLHVGLQKTATTTIQAALHQGREILADQGVAYVGRRFMMRIKDLQAWRAYPHTGKANLGRFAADLRTSVQDHRIVRGGDPLDTVLISNESIVGAMRKGPFLELPFRPRAEGAIADLLDILEPASCRLILLTRRQDTLLESQYMWQIHGGDHFAFDRYLASLRRHPEALSYLDLVSRLESIPGVGGLTLVPFETIRLGLKQFINAILATTGSTLDPSALQFDPEKNPAYSGRALEIALAVNPLLRGRKERRVVRDHLRRSLPVAVWGRAQLLDAAARDEILDAYALENEAVFRRWMPHLPVDLYSNAGAVDRMLAEAP